MKHLRFLLIFSVLLLSYCSTPKKDEQVFMVSKTEESPTIDGNTSDASWQSTIWLPLEQRWTGVPFGFKDFEGSYKVVWTNDDLFLLVAVTDDLLPTTEDATDSLLIFLDADNSGGTYTKSHNAFVFELLPTGTLQTMSNSSSTNSYPISFKNGMVENLSIWEVKIPLQNENGNNNTLQNNQKIGFALAYSDVDSGTSADNLIGSVLISEDEKEAIFTNADYFGTLLLKD